MTPDQQAKFEAAFLVFMLDTVSANRNLKDVAQEFAEWGIKEGKHGKG